MKENHTNHLNILLIIGWPLGQGGHINSTLALSKPLLDYEEIKNVYLLAPKGEKVTYFQNANIIYLPLPNPNSSLFFRLVASFLIFFYSVKYRIHRIHAMDYKCLVPSVMANLVLRKPLVFTKAGGKPLGVKLPSLSHLIVFSKELLDFYINIPSSMNKDVSLIKERIDLDEFQHMSLNKKNEEKVFSIFIAMRLSPAKQFLLDSFFEELKQLSAHQEQIKVLIAGDGALTEDCKVIANSISESNSNIQFDFLGQLNDKQEIYSYYLNSSLTVGHGRGIMEAMALAKPVMLLGFDKLASILVDATNVNQISDYNFSGRNIVFEKDSISLAQLICIDNRKEVLEHAGQFNLSYITNNYSSQIGAQKQKSIYINTNKPDIKGFKHNINWMAKRFAGK